MRLRLLPVLALALLALGAAAGSSSSATATPTIKPFLGDWTMTTGADAALVGQHLVITEANESSAHALVGPEWTNESGTAYYDDYCGSTVTVYAYVVLQYSWAPQGSMGGCLSSESKPHIVFAGSKKEAGNLRIVKSAGLDALDGSWDTIPDGGVCCVRHDVSGELPSVSFTLGEQGHRALPKRNEDSPQFLLTKVLGLGAASLGIGHTVQKPAGEQLESEINDATGTIHFRKWRVYKNGFVDEDRLVLRVEKGGSYREADDAHYAIIFYLRVVVTRSEKNETDTCPVGATGSLSMAEVRDGPGKGSDFFGLTIPRCHVDEEFRNGRHSAKVAVGLADKKP